LRGSATRNKFSSCQHIAAECGIGLGDFARNQAGHAKIPAIAGNLGSARRRLCAPCLGFGFGQRCLCGLEILPRRNLCIEQLFLARIGGARCNQPRRSRAAFGGDCRRIAALQIGDGLARAHIVAQTLDDAVERAIGTGGQHRLTIGCGSDYALRDDLGTKPARLRSFGHDPRRLCAGIVHLDEAFGALPLSFFAMLAFFGRRGGGRRGEHGAAQHHAAPAQHERGNGGSCDQFVSVGFGFHEIGPSLRVRADERGERASAVEPRLDER
jgi:hypothetical protein